MVFDTDGKFLYKIGSIGGGPGEFFRAPLDFSIDEKNKQIYVFEAEPQKIMIFDWEGKLIKENRLNDTWPYAFELLSPNRFAFAYRIKSSKQKYEFAITDSTENIIYQSNKLRHHHTYTSPFPITSNEGNIYFSPNLSNLLCKVGADKITQGTYVDFGKYNLPAHLKTEIQKDFDPSLLKGKDYVLRIKKY